MVRKYLTPYLRVKTNITLANNDKVPPAMDMCYVTGTLSLFASVQQFKRVRYYIMYTMTGRRRFVVK